MKVGDGTLGRLEAAPFNAIIIVAAGGPRVPPALEQQLAIGGRLVMPVGETPTRQYLVRVTRTIEDTFDTETLDEVMFVPLIGAAGWDPETMRDAYVTDRDEERERTVAFADPFERALKGDAPGRAGSRRPASCRAGRRLGFPSRHSG